MHGAGVGEGEWNFQAVGHFGSRLVSAFPTHPRPCDLNIELFVAFIGQDLERPQAPVRARGIL